MQVDINHAGYKMIVFYDDADGHLRYVLNVATGNKMMVETVIEGSGFVLTRQNYFGVSNLCDARYSRIIDADLYIARLLYISPKD